jgi:4-hydroxy-3-methylbut-2-en-1-yl diphosphate synthase IspG/GcpE
LGVTEAGPEFQGTIKSATAFGILLAEGIGDTIRVSLSAPPVQEVKVGLQILQSLNLRERKLEIVSCPSCGRAQVDVYQLANDVTAGLEKMTVPLRVAVMGCVVNGPGERARQTSASRAETGAARSSSRARSSRLFPNPKSWRHSSKRPTGSRQPCPPERSEQRRSSRPERRPARPRPPRVPPATGPPGSPVK